MSDRFQKESFQFVERNTDGLVSLQPPPPRIFETTKVEGGRVYHVLVLPVKYEDGSERRVGIVTDYQSLLRLGRHIVRVLDPSPQDQALDELDAIRGLLEDRD